MRLFHSDAVVAIDWHRRVWWGRPQPRKPATWQVFDRRLPLDYRMLKQKKFARRFMAAQRGERPYPQQH